MYSKGLARPVQGLYKASQGSYRPVQAQDPLLLPL